MAKDDKGLKLKLRNFEFLGAREPAPGQIYVTIMALLSWCMHLVTEHDISAGLMKSHLPLAGFN